MRNLAIINSFGYSIIKNYFEIRKHCCLFTRSFSVCPNTGPTSNTHTSKTAGVFVSFLNFKGIITSRSFFEIPKTYTRVSVADKYPVEQSFSGLKSINLTSNMAIFNLTFKIKLSSIPKWGFANMHHFLLVKVWVLILGIFTKFIKLFMYLLILKKLSTFEKNKNLEGASDFLSRCQLCDPPLQFPRPASPEIISIL